MTWSPIGRPLLAVVFSVVPWAVSALAPEAIDADAGDRRAFEAVIADAAANAPERMPYAQLVQRIATGPVLQGRRYAAAPLEGAPDAERLYAGMARFDCVTYVETVLALSETVASHQHEFGDYAAHLAALRYRHAEPGYCDRLHYFSDWIRSNVSAGRLDDVTRSIADADQANLAFASEPQGFDYLSRHAGQVPALAGSEPRQACVRVSELALTAALPRGADNVPGFEYIPKSRLANVAGRLQAGDIVAWVAELPGLDVIHVGIVVQREDQAMPAFAHASLRNGQVAIAPDLMAYARSLSKQRGILVLRPRGPQQK